MDTSDWIIYQSWWWKTSNCLERSKNTVEFTSSHRERARWAQNVRHSWKPKFRSNLRHEKFRSKRSAFGPGNNNFSNFPFRFFNYVFLIKRIKYGYRTYWSYDFQNIKHNKRPFKSSTPRRRTGIVERNRRQRIIWW